MSNRFLFGAVGLVLLAALAGILTVGSPSEARRERMDQHRYQDLVALALALTCTDKDVTPVLPAEMSVENLRSYCGGRNILDSTLVDKETSEPYKYSRISDGEFSICAKFYDADRAVRQVYRYPDQGWSFNPATGCVTGKAKASGNHLSG